MKTVLLLLTLVLFGFHSNKSRFGNEQIWAYYNKEKVGHWILGKTKVDKLVLNYPGSRDTLLFTGFCDCGCLDGTIIKITDRDQLVATITRKSPILHGDTIMINYTTKEKQSFPMDAVISFKASGNVFNKLTKNKVYAVSMRRMIDLKSRDIHIFDLELK